MTEPAVIAKPYELDSELSQMDLNIEGLRWCIQQAHAEGGFTTRNDVKGWRLIVTHDKLVRAMRERFCGPAWELEDAENQEGIRNSRLGIRIIAANFDEVAGDPNPAVTPSNLRPKGKASWRKARCNQTGWLPGLDLPEPTHQQWQTWVLGICSDDAGVGAELSLPLEFVNNRFSMLVKRIIIRSRGDSLPVDLARQPITPLEEVDIPVARKG